ncbi:WxL domain-containing protein [Enterococcus casseliflavus]|uniref:WxL domain-containing protein n=1 Tax=Enterococcus casseliflavus TaxID=37734 RepID=UPI001C8BF4A6|nr:WxL domain-containing protein [Enterococcus casseliflavus]MBX9116766.1 WxL domain-containing protein [Enterococcus casseliflavus]MBX9127088.1 WxL domain-containing protein [Enterococcus casseliflavus]
MKKKPLKLLLLVIGLVSIPLGFPFLRDAFIAPLYALQAEDEHSLTEEMADLKDADFQFLTSSKQGYLGEEIPIEIVAQQPVTEAAVVLPPEAAIEPSLFPEGRTVEQVEADQWRLLSEPPQSNWLLPLTFAEGSHEVMVGEERLALESQGSPEESGEETEESKGEGVEPENEEQKGKNAHQTEPGGAFPYDADDPGNLYLLEVTVESSREVTNWQELLLAIQTRTVNYIALTESFDSPDRPAEGLSNVEMIDWFGDQNPNGEASYLYLNSAEISRPLLIDGRGHTIDFRSVSVGFNDMTVNPDTPWDITLQNIELYSGNDFGPIQYNDLETDNQAAATIRYHNVNHVGNQLFHGFQSTAILSGSVSSIQKDSYDAALGRGEWRINATDQANFEVGYMDVLDGAKVHLSTIDSGNIWFPHSSNPTFTIGDDAEVTIIANGTGKGEAWGANIFFRYSPILTVGKGATLDLTPKRNSPAISTSGLLPAQTTQINLLEESTLKIFNSGRTSHSNNDWTNIISMPPGPDSSIHLRKGSTLAIEAVNQNRSDSYIIYFPVSGHITIDEDATFDIRSDSRTTGHSLISFEHFNSTITINDAARVNLEKIGPDTGNSSLVRTARITVNNQSIKRWNLRTRIEEPDFEWDNIVRLFARVNEAGVPNRGDISVSALDPTIEAEALDRFSARVQRLLLEKISPIEVTLDPLSNNRSQRNSYTITGETDPGAYVRFSRDFSMPEPVIGPIETGGGDTEWFHVNARVDGTFEFDLSQFDDFDYFRGQEVVTAKVFLNGRRDETSIIVEGINPRDPLNPDADVDPENRPTLPENQGLIGIDFISQFDFGHVPIRSSQAYYPALPQKLRNAEDDLAGGERPNYVQISDRREEPTGWTLSARMDEAGFVSEEGHQLRGVQLLLNNIRMATTGSNTSRAPTYWESRELNTGRQILAKADEGQGSGTWVQRFGDGETMDQSVMLEVPVNATPQATSYTGIIHWELSFVPELD